MKLVKIYTDGACSGNPGPGGYGIVMVCGEKRKEISQGYKVTTNNRMELRAAIAAIKSLKFPCRVEITSDSKYVTDAFNKGWIENWKKKNWSTIKNPDLWREMEEVASGHTIKWVWVKGHNGHAENEICDQLAVNAYRGKSLIDDDGYKI